MYDSETSSDKDSIYDDDDYDDYDSDYPDDLPKLDSIVMSVIDKFINRAEFGKNKYGTDLDREDLTMLEWINHAQEEHMDAILYLEKIRNLETRRLTENPQKKDSQLKTNTLKILTQCVAVFIAIVCYNCTIVYFWSGR
jgi:hypothetical protein